MACGSYVVFLLCFHIKKNSIEGKSGKLRILLSVLGFKETAVILLRIFMFD